MCLSRPTSLTGKQIFRTEYLVTDSLIPDATFRSHAGENRHEHVNIIVDDHLALGIVEPVQPARILGKRAFPCDRHSKEQGIKTGVVKTLTKIASGRDNDPFLGLGNRSKSRCDVAALLLALASAQNNHVPREAFETPGHGFQMSGALGYHDR